MFLMVLSLELTYSGALFSISIKIGLLILVSLSTYYYDGVLLLEWLALYLSSSPCFRNFCMKNYVCS